MTTGIAHTLREKLFEHPAPRRLADFSTLAPVMFPGRGRFLDFLGERHAQEQIEIAKHVLLRLAYQSRVAPPNKFLYNLLDTESRLAGTAAKGAFNGRDHFVHLVNLYLLGLYIYWYHDGLHGLVNRQLRALVDDSGLTEGERRRRVSAAFVHAWREFVLFHDLGYPWEVSPGMDKPESFLAPFRDVMRYAGKDASLFVISQLMALRWCQRQQNSSTLGYELRPYLKKQAAQATLFPEQTLKQWLDAERMPLPGDAAVWRLVQAIVDPSELVSVLETVADARPVACDREDIHRALPPRPRQEVEDEIFDHDGFTSLAEAGAVPIKLRQHYRWAHYVRDFSKHYKAFIGQVFEAGAVEADSIIRFFDSFLGQHSPTELAEDADFDDYGYAIYHALLEGIEFDRSIDDGRPSAVVFDTIVRSEVRGLQGRLLGEIGRSLQQVLLDRSKQLEEATPSSTLETRPLGDYLRELLDGLNTAGDLAVTVESSLTTVVKQRIRLKRELYDIYVRIKRQMAGSGVTSFFGPSGASGGRPAPRPEWTVFNTSSPSAVPIGELLKKRGLVGLISLESYAPSWEPKDRSQTFADHGLASGLLHAEMQQVWHVMCATPNDALKRMLTLRGAEEQALTGRKNVGQTNEVLYSILVHNLYPNSFANASDKRFRTRRDESAFTFFALLCDSLQPWDRKRLFNQASGALPYSSYAENFDLQVHGASLRITERGDRLRIEERQASLRSYLDLYLHDAATLVRLQLSEWL